MGIFNFGVFVQALLNELCRMQMFEITVVRGNPLCEGPQLEDVAPTFVKVQILCKSKRVKGDVGSKTT